MSKIHIKACPICGGTHFSIVHHCQDHYATGEAFDILRCGGCGFHFTQDFPAEAEIGRYYETPDYISHSDTAKGLMNQTYHLVRQWMLRKKTRLIQRASGLRQGYLLDIGTGTGYFPHAMQMAGWQVAAIEKSDKARAFATSHFGLDVRDSEGLATYPDRKFDVITMWHVLEHIEHLDEMLLSWKRLTKAHGTVVLALPNHLSADAAHYGTYWAAYDVPRHLWHFDAATVDQLAKKHGFTVEKILPMPFDAFYVSMLSERYKGHKNFFICGMYEGFKAWLQALGHPQKSSSLIYILKKNQAYRNGD